MLHAQEEDIRPVFQTGHHSKINKIRFHPDNKHLISIGDDGKIVVWDINLGLQRESVIAHQGGVSDFDFINDSTIITTGADHHLKLWSLPNLEQKKAAHKVVDLMTSLTVINESLVCLVSKYVYFYNLSTKELTRLNYASNDRFSSVDFNSKQQTLAIAGAKENYTATVSIKNDLKYSQYLIDNTHKVRFADNRYLFQANIDGTVRYLNFETGVKRTFTLSDDINYVSDMALSNNRLAVSTAFGYVAVIDLKNHSVYRKLSVNGYALTSVDFSQNGQWLATGDMNGNIYLYDVNNFRLNQVLKSASPGILDVKVSGSELFIGYNNGVLRKIDLSSNRVASNSIQLNQLEESDGINYAVLKIDSITNNNLYFQALKTDRHHAKSGKLNKVVLLSCLWQLEENQITIRKDVSTKMVKNYAANLFYSKNSFHISDFQQDSKQLKIGQSIWNFKKGEKYFYKLNGNDTINMDTYHEGAITGLKSMPKFGLILSYGEDGSIRFWNLNGQYLSALYLSGQYNFAWFNHYNYYYASKEILNKIGFLNKGKLYAYEQYDLFFNRPDLVMKALPFLTNSETDILRRAYEKRLEKLKIVQNKLNINDDIPLLEVNYLGTYSTKTDRVMFKLKAIERQGGLRSLSYILNGIEHQIDIKGAPKVLEQKIEIMLSSGINRIEFYCKSQSGIKSLTHEEVVTCEKHFDKPDLYFVSIGVSDYKDKKFKLNYARKDAEEMSGIFSKSKRYGNIYQKTILDDAMTKSKLSDIDQFLGQAKTNDVVIVFYAGHGVLNSNLDYYLATYDINFEKPEENGVLFDDFETRIEKLSCRNKLVLIDACHSGELDKTAIIVNSAENEHIDSIEFRSAGVSIMDGDELNMGVLELSKLLFVDMRSSQGTNIISSSSGTEFAIEGEAWQNGVFTYALKKALRNEAADLNGDDDIRVMELQIYLRDEVSTLSKGRQNPISRKENFKNNFVIW